MSATEPLAIVVLVSGSGSNLQALIDQQQNELAPFKIKSVISNKSDAYGLERARAAGIQADFLDHTSFESRETFDQALVKLIDQHNPAFVILAGYMRILSGAFVERYADRLLNIHPSLLPKYKGLHTHQRALEAGDTTHGASVHLVTEELDDGPVILQVKVPVDPDDTEESLAARVLTQEHVIYPTVVKWFAAKRLAMKSGRVQFDKANLDAPIVLDFQQAPPQ